MQRDEIRNPSPQGGKLGTLNAGHYVAYGRSSIDGLWYLFDAKCVQRLARDEVVSNVVGAYILF